MVSLSSSVLRDGLALLVFSFLFFFFFESCVFGGGCLLGLPHILKCRGEVDCDCAAVEFGFCVGCHGVYS